MNAVREKQWRYAITNDLKGPISFDELKHLWNTGSINETTKVWSMEMKGGWSPIQDIPDLLAVLSFASDDRDDIFDVEEDLYSSRGFGLTSMYRKPKMKKSYLGKYNMDGYATRGKPMVKKDGEKYYSIQHYQGKHEGEFSVMEVDENGVANGQAQLFKKGILQMSWTMKNGEREGELTVYKKGVVDHVLRWDDLREAEEEGIHYRLRAIVNDESGKELLEEMIVGSGTVVYCGEFDKDSREREGFGIEYDEESGLEKRSGYFRNGELVHVCQEFEEEEDDDDDVTIDMNREERKGNCFSQKRLEMIEYGGDKEEDNVNDYSSLRPTYVGKYAFDPKQFRFLRCGIGHEIGEYSGISRCISEWNEMGNKVKGSEVELFDGWYYDKKGGSDQSLLNIARMDIQLMICPAFEITQLRSIEELVIGDNSYNDIFEDTSLMKIELRHFSRLKRIEIGSNCFKNIRDFIIDGLMNLNCVKIGDNCFSIYDESTIMKMKNNEINKIRADDGLFCITNCPKLLQLDMGRWNCIKTKSFELSKNNSIRSINIGDYCFGMSEDLLLKELPSLEIITFGDRSCVYCHVAVFENLPKLHTISFHGDNALAGDSRDDCKTIINGYKSYDNTLIMKNLPSLNSIQSDKKSSSIHYHIGHVILENIPNLTEDNIHYCSSSFYYTVTLQATNAPALEKCIRNRSESMKEKSERSLSLSRRL